MSEQQKRLAYSKKLRSKSTLTKRVLVRKSKRHIYLVLIDDATQKALFEFSTLSLVQKNEKKNYNNISCAKSLADSACDSIKEFVGTNKVLFDRRKYKYHGVVKQLAESLREKGIIA
jgi:large subunit ribosomal protein L18